MSPLRKVSITKNESFGDLFIFLNPLMLRYHRISKNKNLIQNNLFLEYPYFSKWTQYYFYKTICFIIYFVSVLTGVKFGIYIVNTPILRGASLV